MCVNCRLAERASVGVRYEVGDGRSGKSSLCDFEQCCLWWYMKCFAAMQRCWMAGFLVHCRSPRYRHVSVWLFLLCSPYNAPLTPLYIVVRNNGGKKLTYVFPMISCIWHAKRNSAEVSKQYKTIIHFAKAILSREENHASSANFGQCIEFAKYMYFYRRHLCVGWKIA